MITIDHQSAGSHPHRVQAVIHHITSDQHIGHLRISELADRDFTLDDTAEHPTVPMDNHLRDQWNSVVSPEDTVLLLGDIALGRIEYSLHKWGEFNGIKLLIPGNHDRVASTYSKNHRERFALRYEEAGFTILPETVTLTVADEQGEFPLIASHYPYLPETLMDGTRPLRYPELHPVDDGKTPMVHGHTHSPEVHAQSDRMFHVGVDAHNMTPVSAVVIEEWARRVRIND